MKTINKILALLGGMAIMIFIITIYGCSSPELTTGKLAFNNRDFVKAEEELKKGLQIDQQDPEGWYMLGVSQIEIGKYDEAKASFEKSKKLSNAFDINRLSYWGLKFNSSINYYNSGLEGLKKSDTSLAYPNFRKAIVDAYAATSILPDSLEPYRVMGDAEFYLKNTDNAIKNYEFVYNKTHSSKDAGDLAKAYYTKGLALRQNEQYNDASTWFKKSLDLKELSKDNDYYNYSMFNMGIVNYQIAAKMASDGLTDYKPYLQTAINYLEPLTTSVKDKTFLKDVYEFLINAYDAIGDEAKKEDATNKRNAL